MPVVKPICTSPPIEGASGASIRARMTLLAARSRTRGRGHQRAAAIVPDELVERYEALLDGEDGRIARERLADLDAGRTSTVSAGEVERALQA